MAEIQTDKQLEIDEIEKPIIIIEASLKDNFCNYKFKINTLQNYGAVHKVDGPGIIKDTLIDAFQNFNVHLAAIDDVFKHSKTEVVDIDTMHTHELAYLYHVTGFKMKGSSESESIVLYGTKYVSSGRRIGLETPTIPLDSLSSYKWYNELKAAADAARYEVELYEGGNYTIVEAEEEKPKLKQTKMTFLAPEGEEKPTETKEEKAARKAAAKAKLEASKVD